MSTSDRDAGLTEGLGVPSEDPQELANEVAMRAVNIAAWAIRRGLNARRPSVQAIDLVWLNATVIVMRDMERAINDELDQDVVLAADIGHPNVLRDYDTDLIIASRKLAAVLKEQHREAIIESRKLAAVLKNQHRKAIVLSDQKKLDMRLQPRLEALKGLPRRDGFTNETIARWDRRSSGSKSNAKSFKNTARELVGRYVPDNIERGKDQLEKLESRIKLRYAAFKIGKGQWLAGNRDSARKNPEFSSILRWFVASRYPSIDTWIKAIDFDIYAHYIAEDVREFPVEDAQIIEYIANEVAGPMIEMPSNFGKVVVEAWHQAISSDLKKRARFELPESGQNELEQDEEL